MKRYSTRPRLAAVAIAVGLALLFSAQPSLANVQGAGDITPSQSDTDFLGNPITLPDLPNDGGVLGGPIVIGGTGQMVSDTEFGSLSINDPVFTLPFEVDSATLGMESTGVGIATVTGFLSEWIVRGGNLVVAENGQGFVDIENGARVANVNTEDGNGMSQPGTAGDTIIGMNFGSYGEVNVSGVASRLQTSDLFVGYHGQAYLNITDRATVYSSSSRNSASSTTDGTAIGFQNGGDGRVRVSDPGTRWFVTDEGTNPFVNIGTDIGTSEDDNGRGVLEIANGGTVLVGRTNPIAAPDEFNGGGVSIRELGYVDLSTGGVLLTYNLLNEGVIRGDGVVRATNSFINDGEIRNAATLANEREQLLFAEANTTLVNNNLVESLGGEMEFLGAFDNALEGDIIARDAVMRFNGGVTNSGEIGLAGDTTIYGTISSIGGDLFFFDESTVVLRGDLTLDPASTFFAAIGDGQSNVDIVGSASLDGLALLDVTAGTNAQVGDSYNIITSTGPITGAFDNATFPSDGLIWTFDYTNPNVVSVEATALAAAPSGADFDGSGIVDAIDLAVWTANFPTGSGATGADGDADGDGDVDFADLILIQQQIGGPPPLVAPITAVPEPGALALLTLAAACVPWRRR